MSNHLYLNIPTIFCMISIDFRVNVSLHIYLGIDYTKKEHQHDIIIWINWFVSKLISIERTLEVFWAAY